MTTIAWDGKSVAADSQCTYGSYISPVNYRKLIKRDGIVFACTGSGPLFSPLVDWYLSGHDPKSCPTATGDYTSTLLVFRDGKAFMLKTEMPYPEEMHAPDAWGAGAEFAIGAMHAGADASRAVEIAIKCNPYTGGEVLCFELETPRP